MTKKLGKVKITPRTALLEKIGVGNFTVAEAIAELVANCFDARIYSSEGSEEDAPQKLEVKISLSQDKISILDNASGMNHDVLGQALTMANDMDVVTGKSRTRMGLFGLGMKSASSSLGRNWSITTKDVVTGDTFQVNFDLLEFSKQETWEAEIEQLEETDQSPLHEYKSGTYIEITKLRTGSPSDGAVVHFLGNAFKPLLIGDQNSILVNNHKVSPQPYNLVEGTRRELEITIDQEKGWKVTGWAGLDSITHNDGLYGFNLFRNEQLIEQWNKDFFRAHTMNSRVVGDLHLNFVDTNFHKQGFSQSSEAWKLTVSKLREELKPFTKASQDMVGTKNDPGKMAKAIGGIDVAFNNIPTTVPGTDMPSSSDQGDGLGISSGGGSTFEPSDTIVELKDAITKNFIRLNGEEIHLQATFEDFGDETVLWDFIFDEETRELQAVVNETSNLFTTAKDPKFLAILALADVVAKFLITKRNVKVENAMEFRDKWILEAI